MEGVAVSTLLIALFPVRLKQTRSIVKLLENSRGQKYIDHGTEHCISNEQNIETDIY